MQGLADCVPAPRNSWGHGLLHSHPIVIRLLLLLLAFGLGFPAFGDHLSAGVPATEVLEAARSALGGDAINQVRSLLALANGKSPVGPYTLEVHSIRGEGLLFRYRRRGVAARDVVVSPPMAWTRVAPMGEVEKLPWEQAEMIRGHEFQIIAIDPASHFHGFQPAEAGRLDGTETLFVSGVNSLGQRCEVHFDPTSHRPVGLVVAADVEPVRVRFLDWEDVDGVMLPNRISALDAAGEFILDFHTLQVNAVAPDALDIGQTEEDRVRETQGPLAPLPEEGATNNP